MFALDDPYISDFCTETINKNNYPALNSDLLSGKLKNPLSDDEFKKIYFKSKKIYTNSENSIQRIISILNDDEFERVLTIFKDKSKTRELLKEIYPDFFYKKVKIDDLTKLDPENLKFPLVIKPAVGFLSFGVYTVFSKDDFREVVQKAKNSVEKAKGFFPKSVLSGDNFILEDYIEGEEFALDVYFDKNSNPVILNIFKHPFVDKNDVSDRMYITSGEIISKYLPLFEDLFKKIGKIGKLKNFPAHIELRANEDKIIPIEVNPFRFAGWCLCDIAYFAWKINPYEYFMEEKKPDWDKILKDNNSTYAFVMAEVPSDIDKNSIDCFSFDDYKKDLNAEILDVREYDFKKKPMFNSLFIKSKDYNQIKHILKLNMKDYIRRK